MNAIDVDPLVGTTVADGRYQIQRLLGAGGMATVYLARQVSMDRLVALKLILPQAGILGRDVAKRFHQEMCISAKIEHPNTIRVHDYGETSGRLYLAMEYLEGKSLRDIIQSDGPLGVARTLRIAVQIAKALVAAHQEGVVHRDLKPENMILLNRYGERDFVKILDFGIARSLDPGAEHLTATGGIIGTAAYMSPEQAAGQAVDGRTDLYALGTIVYEMLTGMTPFQKPTAMSLLVAQMTEPPPPILERVPTLSPGLAAFIGRLLEKQPDARPADAGEALSVLTLELEHEESRRIGATTGVVAVANSPASRSFDGNLPSPAKTAPTEVLPSISPTEVLPSVSPTEVLPSISPTEVLPTPSVPISPSHAFALPPVSDSPTSEAGATPSRREPTTRLSPLATHSDGGIQSGIGSGREDPSFPEGRPSSSRWPIVVLLCVLAVGVGAVVAFRRHPPAHETQQEGRLPQNEAPSRVLLDRGLQAWGETPPAADCQSKEERTVSILVEAMEALRPAAGQANPGKAIALLEGGGDDSAERWVMLARAQFANGDDNGVGASVRRALALCPAYAAAHNIEGKALQRAGRLDEAEAAFGRALDSDKAYAAPRFNLALLALKKGNASGAIAILDTLVQRLPDTPNVFLVRGQARLITKDLAGAEGDLREATRRSPQQADAWLLLGQVLGRRGKKGERQNALCRAKALGAALPNLTCSE